MSTPDPSKINLHNWRDHPHSVHSFVNIDKYLTTSTIRKSNTPSRLQTEPRTWDEFQVDYRNRKLDLPNFISVSNTDGLIILQHGKIVYEDYFNNNEPTSKHIMMSMTKSVTGLLVGILQSQGKLSVNDTVSKYIPELRGSCYENTTLQQLLDMRARIKYPEGTHEYRVAAGWDPVLNGDDKHLSLSDFIMNFKPHEEIDDRFEYISVNTDLVGWIIERVSGKKWYELVEELIWKPMGAEFDAVVAVDSEGLARSAGGMAATLRDIARLGQLMLNDGKNDKGEAVIPQEWIKDTIHGGDVEAFSRGSFARGFKKGVAYRNYWFTDSEEDRLIALGIYGQQLMIDRKNGIVMAKTGSQPESIDFGKVALTVAAFKEIQRILAEDQSELFLQGETRV